MLKDLSKRNLTEINGGGAGADIATGAVSIAAGLFGLVASPYAASLLIIQGAITLKKGFEQL